MKDKINHNRSNPVDMNTEGLNFTPDQAQWRGEEIVGCKKHPNTKLVPANTDAGFVVICVPKNQSETHIIG